MLEEMLKIEFLVTFKEYQVLQDTLNGMPYGCIYTVKRNGHAYYYHQYYTKERRIQKYVRLKAVSELKEKLALSSSLKEKREVLRKALEKMRRFLKSLKINADELIQEDIDKAIEREKQLREQRREKYSAMEDPYGNRKFHTNRGEYVRSKSEVIIANILSQEGLVYTYERKISVGFHRYKPDFTIETGHGEIYWEHCGLMDDKNYGERWDRKHRDYAEHGIREGKNLIVTYDDENGGIDSQEILRIVNQYLK